VEEPQGGAGKSLLLPNSTTVTPKIIQTADINFYIVLLVRAGHCSSFM